MTLKINLFLKMNYKNIHIGNLIHQKVKETKIDIDRICNFFKYEEEKITSMYTAENLSTDDLLRWSKLLEYDFFRIYTQHLIIYAPSTTPNLGKNSKQEKSKLPSFRKNIYTKELIDFILELIKTGQKTKLEIIEEYRIPKTTLYKWISKYND